MPNKDVGRNEPCPCGSGRKYKHCCLRKKKKRRRSKRKKKDWMRRFEETMAELDEADVAPKEGEVDWTRFNLLSEAWHVLDENLPDDVDDLESAQDALHDDAPSIEGLFRNAFTILAAEPQFNAELARHGAQWASDVLERLPEMSEFFRARLVERRAECLQYGKQWTELEPVARQVIEYEPARPRGYALLADALLEKPHPQPEKAVEVLEDALARPVDDPKSWELEKRLKEAKEAANSEEDTIAEEGEETRTLDEAWDAFWDEFRSRDVEGKFQLARRTIDEEPHFDGRWAFDMMIEGLLDPAREHDRGDDWISLVEHLRETRPEIAREESGYLAMHEMEFRLWSGDEVPEETFDYLFSTPVDHIDLVFDTLYLAAYFGELGPAAEHLRDGWTRLQCHGDQLMSSAYGKWGNWTLQATVARWAEAEIETPRSLDEIEEALGDVADPLDPEAMEAFGEAFLGPFDEGEFVARLQEPPDEEDVLPIVLRFARLLVERYDWAPSKALLAATPLRWLWSEQRSSGHPAQSRYSADRGSNLQKLRKRLEGEHWMMPDPNLVDGVADEARTMTPMGTAHPAAAFLEAISYVPGWLTEAGRVEESRVLESVSHHLRRRMERHADKLGRWSSTDPTLERHLRRAIERLE